MSTNAATKRIAELGRQIAILQAEIVELGWDTNFGMYTRNALLRYCRALESGTRQVAFIDLEAIHSLNLRYGYEEVNARVSAAFDTTWRREHTVGRWFSGDEIAIVFDGDTSPQKAQSCIGELEGRAHAQGLRLTWALGRWDVQSESIEEAMAPLIEELRCRALADMPEYRCSTDLHAECSTPPQRRVLLQRLHKALHKHLFAHNRGRQAGLD